MHLLGGYDLLLARALTSLLFQGPLQISFPIFSRFFQFFQDFFQFFQDFFNIPTLRQDVDMNRGCITGPKNMPVEEL